MKRTILFKVHSFAGLLSGLFILLMSLSGAALVYREAVDVLTEHPAGIQEPSAIMIDVNQSYKAVQQKFPEAQISNCELPGSSSDVLLFTLYDPSYQSGRKAMQVFVSGTTFLKHRGGSDDIRHNFMAWLGKFHNTLHLGKKGEWLLGAFALVFLLSLITGTVLFRKSIRAVLLFRRSVYNRHNLHQVIAVWALLFNLMIAVTGFWMQRYVFRKEFYASNNYTPVFKKSPDLRYSYKEASREIKSRYNDFTAHVIYFPQSSSGSTYVYGSRLSKGYLHSEKFSDEIVLDSTGRLSSTRLFEENTPAARYDIINSQLHMGNFGGPGIRLIYFVFGLSGAVLSISGFGLWWKRRSNIGREVNNPEQ